MRVADQIAEHVQSPAKQLLVARPSVAKNPGRPVARGDGPSAVGKTARASKTSAAAAAASSASTSSSDWLRLKLRREATGLQAHDLVTQGVSVADAKQVMGAFQIINEAQIFAVLGISSKTMQRRAASGSKTLDANASDRAMRLVSVTTLAIEVLGSQHAAELWLSGPAMGLDGRCPIDLLQSSGGTQMVKTLLSRMDYGVYA